MEIYSLIRLLFMLASALMIFCAELCLSAQSIDYLRVTEKIQTPNSQDKNKGRVLILYAQENSTQLLPQIEKILKNLRHAQTGKQIFETVNNLGFLQINSEDRVRVIDIYRNLDMGKTVVRNSTNGTIFDTVLSQIRFANTYIHVSTHPIANGLIELRFAITDSIPLIDSLSHLTSKSKDSLTSKSKDSLTSKSKDSLTSKSKDSLTSKSKDSLTSKSKDSLTSKSKDSLTSKSKDSLTSKSKDSLTSKSKDSGITIPPLITSRSRYEGTIIDVSQKDYVKTLTYYIRSLFPETVSKPLINLSVNHPNVDGTYYFAVGDTIILDASKSYDREFVIQDLEFGWRQLDKDFKSLPSPDSTFPLVPKQSEQKFVAAHIGSYHIRLTVANFIRQIDTIVRIKILGKKAKPFFEPNDIIIPGTIYLQAYDNYDKYDYARIFVGHFMLRRVRLLDNGLRNAPQFPITSVKSVTKRQIFNSDSLQVITKNDFSLSIDLDSIKSYQTSKDDSIKTLEFGCRFDLYLSRYKEYFKAYSDVRFAVIDSLGLTNRGLLRFTTINKSSFKIVPTFFVSAYQDSLRPITFSNYLGVEQYTTQNLSINFGIGAWQVNNYNFPVLNIGCDYHIYYNNYLREDAFNGWDLNIGIWGGSFLLLPNNENIKTGHLALGGRAGVNIPINIGDVFFELNLSGLYTYLWSGLYGWSNRLFLGCGIKISL